MDSGMRLVLPIMGLLMLIIALGELGLIRRLLPDLSHSLSPVVELSTGARGGRYWRVAGLGLAIATTFGIVCTRPTYLALIVYVATVGSVAYGALAMSVYGAGMGGSIALSALGLLQASRSARLQAWLSARMEAIHTLQGVAFAFFGAIPIWFFWLRYVLGVR
jgi:cytochrome c biogenesis protein CcdA